MKPLLKILIAIIIIVGLAIIVLIIVHYQLRFALANYISDLKAKGEPMDLTQVIPASAQAEQNGVPHIADALTNRLMEALYTNEVPITMQFVAPGKAIVGWQQSEIRTSDGTNSWQRIESALSIAQSNILSFQNLTNYTTLDFHWDYQKSWSLESSYPSDLQVAASCLFTAAFYDLHERKTSEACVILHTMLTMAQEMADDRLEISQMVRMNMARMSTHLTWEILQDPNVSEADLASLQEVWESCEFVGPVRQSYLSERVISVRSMDHYLQNPSLLWSYVSGDGGFSMRASELYWQWFGSYNDEKRALEIYQIWINAAQMAETNYSFQAGLSCARTNFIKQGLEIRLPSPDSMRIDIDALGVNSLFSDDAYDSFSLLRKAMISETVKSITITAITLKRYDLQHHKFPPALNDLTPVLLKTNLIDYMNGQALHYRSNTNGTFLLYSVGEDGVDDGGDVTPAKPSYLDWLRAKDWVWPQPATPAEVQDFYEHPPK